MSQSKGKVRWGIMSTGWIASCFAKGLKGTPDAEIVGVASRTLDRAQAAGKEWGLSDSCKYYGTYEELAKDPNIDIIYIATPHSHHYDNALLVLNNNKSALVEKAFTVNTREAEEIVALAKSKGLFIAEAMWTRFFPATKKVKEIVQSGKIGELRYLNVDLSFNAKSAGKASAEGRLYNPDLAGGALLDVGIYPLSYAFNLLGRPASYDSYAHIVKGQTEGTQQFSIDERFSIFAKWDGGQTAFLAGAFDTVATKEALVVGSEGYIRIPHFLAPRQIIVRYKDAKEEVVEKFPWPEGFSEDYDQNGLVYEAQQITECVKNGKTESDLMTTADTIALMKLMDEIRGKWGVSYPNDVKK